MTLLIILLVIIILIMSYIIYNLYKKNDEYENWVTELRERIDVAMTKLKAIDSKGSFEADDEVGYFFKFLKDTLRFIDDMK